MMLSMNTLPPLGNPSYTRGWELAEAALKSGTMTNGPLPDSITDGEMATGWQDCMGAAWFDQMESAT